MSFSRHPVGAELLLIGLIAMFSMFAPAAGAGNAAAALIVKKHKSDWRIVVPAKSSAGVKFAATELQKYISQISGCQLPIEEKAGHHPAILIGLRNELAGDDRKSLPDRASGYDGYSIAVRAGTGKSGRVIIGADNGPGAVYAAYDLLEHVSCRWFYPTQDPNDPEAVPRLATIALNSGSWAVASPMKHRICNGSGWFFEMNVPEAIQQVDWAMKNRYNMMGWQGETSTSGKSLPWQYKKLGDMGVLAELEKREMTMHGPAHSFDQFLPNEYFKKHPEWFGLRNRKRVPQAFAGAQFCWSNPEARRRYIDNAEAFITHAPLIHIFCSLPFDGGIACDCETCRKMGASNLLMILMSEMIARLSVSRPDVLVEATGGYGPASDPPTDPALVHPKQRIVWAHWGRYHGWGYDDPRYDQKQNLEKWHRAVGDGITVCQYYTDNFAEPWVMAPFTIALKGDRKYFLREQIDSVYMLMWPREYWWNHSLNGYLGGRCFYNVSLDPYDLIRDYARDYFGPQAGPLLGSYLEEWARNPDLSYHVRGDSTPAERATLAEQRKKWIEPAIAAVRSDPLLSYRVAKVEKLHTLAQRLMDLHRQREEIQKLRRAGEFEEAAKLLNAARADADSVAKMFDTLADLKQGLTEHADPTFIGGNLRNWIEDESKLVAAKRRHHDSP